MHDRDESLKGGLEIPGASSGEPASTASGRHGAEPLRREHATGGGSMAGLASALLKRWKIAFVMPVVAGLVAAVISLLIIPRYTAYVVFVPESNSPRLNLPAGLGAVTGSFGFQLPVDRNSPGFYADVIRSRTLRDQVLSSSFVDPRRGAPADTATLLDILEIEGDSEARRLERGRKVLTALTLVRYNNATRVVNVAITTYYPRLSADIANRSIELLNRFNVETRQSNARLRRRFIEERVEQAEGELLEAEQKLKRFLQVNLEYRGSPELLLQHQRLQRQVDITQQVFTTLRRAYEEARIEEVNDTPIITVIDEAIPPERRSSPRRKLIVIVTFLLASVVGFLGALGREYVDRARRVDNESFERLIERWAELRQELRSPFRRLLGKRS